MGYKDLYVEGKDNFNQWKYDQKLMKKFQV